MKRFLTVFALAASAVFGQDPAPAPAPTETAKEKKPRIAARKERQQERVAEGVSNGSLTPKEAAKIEAKEAKLNREIRKDRKDGGGLTAKERAKIEAKQDKVSREIAKEKHDKQKQ